MNTPAATTVRLSSPAVTTVAGDLEAPSPIRTPDQRVRVFTSSTLQELAAERQAVRDAVTRLRLVPVMFELGARSHPAREVYRAYLAQSQIFVGIYWQSYGWVAPGQVVSGLEDEYLLSAGMPRLIYVKSPAPDRDPRLTQMLTRMEADGGVSYQQFTDAAELQRLVENDLAVLLSERFEVAQGRGGAVTPAPLEGALPAPATSLIDRDQEVAAISALVLRDGARLVTLTGPGGVGKSRLAAAVAGRLQTEFADGVRFVDLAPVPAAELVPAAVAAALGLSTSGRNFLTDVVSYLRGRQLLLVLDNFEQVTGAAPLAARLLSAAPGLVALVTSRAVLRLSGEHEVPVLPLATPPARVGQAPGDLDHYAAVRLFAERARAASPEFKLTRKNAEAVAEICRQLDGLPLAIELAAARVRLLPPRALLDRLNDPLQVLTGGPRDLPDRQRTLRNTLDWSFGLLSAAEQTLFARLGVFAGTFGLPAVAAICGEDQPADHATATGQVMDTMSSLVDSSLVRAEPTDDEPRFSLLETIRQYAQERLRESGDWARLHDRHAAYFLALAKPTATELGGAGQLAWLNRLETRRGNLSAALSWLVDTGQLGQAVRMIGGTWRFWRLHGHAEELARHASRLLAASDRLPPDQRALALSGAGFTFMAGGDHAGARSMFEQSLPLYRQEGDKLGAALAAATLGHLLASQDEDARASTLIEQTLAELHGTGADQPAGPQRLQYLLALALAANFLGQIQLSHRDHDRAARMFTDGLNAARSAQEHFTILVSLYDLALSSHLRGDLARAARLLKEGVAVAAEAGDQSAVAYYLESLAAVASDQGDGERAVSLLSAADALLQGNGSGWLHAYVPRAPHGEKVLAALRSRVGDAAFEQARADGRSLDGSRAVQQAVEQAQRAAVPA